MAAHKIQFCLDAFQSEKTRRRSEENLVDMLWTLVRANMRYLRDEPNTPPLYQSGVRYLGEPYGCENWQDIPTTLQLGTGDCEDLACWRAAELRAKGYPAAPTFYWRRISIRNPTTHQIEHPLLYHILVLLPSGQLDDPSRQLGMGRTPSPLAKLAV